MSSGISGEAKLKYLDGTIREISPGSCVLCAVTGTKILLEDLKYWSVDLQEAYIDAEKAVQRWKETQES
jgi:hypothetical protein